MFRQNMLFYCFLLLIKFKKCQVLLEAVVENQATKDFYMCALSMLNVNNLFDITLVNVKRNHLFPKMVYDGIRPRLVINRDYLSPDLMIHNEAYAIFSDDYEDLIVGLKDLTKGYYWNPNKTVVIAVEYIEEEEIRRVFEELYDVYVTKIGVVTKLKDSKPYIFIDNSKETNGLQKHSCTEAAYVANAHLQNRRTFSKESNKVTIFVSNVPPFMYENNFDGKHKLIGYEDIYLNMARQFGDFELHLKSLARISTELTGMVLNNFTATGPFKYIQNGECDGVIGGYVVTQNRVRLFDFTYPHLSDHLLFVVPKSKPMTKWQAMFLSFTLTIWLLIFAVYIVFTVVAMKLNYFGIRRDDCWLTFLITMGYFFGNTHRYRGRSSKRWYITYWAILTWLLSCCYQSKLSSVFTKPVRTHQVNTIGEILDEKYRMCVNKYSYAYVNLTGDSMLTDMFARRVAFETHSECLQYVAEGGRRVMVMSKAQYQEVESLYRDNNGRPTLHVLSDPCSYIWRTMYMRRGHPYLEKFRWIEMQTIASGLAAKTSRDLKFTHKMKYDLKSERAFQQITVYDLQGIYIIFGCGCTLSLATFLIEVYVSRNNRP